MPDNLEARFWALAQTQTSGFGFAPDCEAMTRQLISQGMQKLVAQGFAANEYKIHEAEANLSRFINAMTHEALRLGLSKLHEPTFNAAMSSLCPLWPFC